MTRTTIVMDDELQEEAKELGVNVSEVCREAVRRVVDSAKAAKAHGDDFETIIARQGAFDRSELVEFHGRLVFTDDRGDLDVYLTAGGNVAVVDDGFLEYGDIEDLDLPGEVRQSVEEALGKIVTPTFLDI